MSSISEYINFIGKKGRALSEINPGSDEVALTVDDALLALELLRNGQTIILGGDILSEENNGLTYAYQLWGEEYIYLNWYCDKINNESEGEYLQRSYEVAKTGISNANEVAEQLEKKCLIVFVI